MANDPRDWCETPEKRGEGMTEANIFMLARFALAFAWKTRKLEQERERPFVNGAELKKNSEEFLLVAKC